MLSVSGLTKDYGSMRAVDDVSFEVKRGEIVGFLGPNGAGKSTTLRMITGFLSPTAGRVTIDGIDALAEPLRARQRFGYMPEGVPLYPELRVLEYLRYRAELKGVAGSTKKAAIAALDRAGVRDAEQRVIGQLSKGYRQRVGLADALLGDPPLLILDEPTSGLDPNQIRHVRELIRSFAGEKTVFLSTHILPEVEATCERVIILSEGRFVGEGAPSTLRTEGVRTAKEAPAAQGVAKIRVQAKADEEALRQAAGAIEGASGASILQVERLEDEDGVVSMLLGVAGDEAAERVFDAMVTAGIRLRALQQEGASLEEVFASLTAHEDEHVADGAEGDRASEDETREGSEEE